MPIIGQYTISDVAKISSLLHERYGRIVRFSGLIGRPDLLFIYDADEIEKVSTTRLGTCRNSFMRRQHARLGTHGAQQSIKSQVQVAANSGANCWQIASRSLHDCNYKLLYPYLQCYRSEGATPFRPSMPSLVKYKSVVRKDFFGELGGVVGV